MTLMGIREFSRKISSCVEHVEETGKPLVLTRHGHPVAALVPVDSHAFEEIVLSMSPGFVDDLAASRRDIAAGTSSSLRDYVDEHEREAVREHAVEAEDARPARSAG